MISIPKIEMYIPCRIPQIGIGFSVSGVVPCAELDLPLVPPIGKRSKKSSKNLFPVSVYRDCTQTPAEAQASPPHQFGSLGG